MCVQCTQSCLKDPACYHCTLVQPSVRWSLGQLLITLYWATQATALNDNSVLENNLTLCSFSSLSLCVSIIITQFMITNIYNESWHPTVSLVCFRYIHSCIYVTINLGSKMCHQRCILSVNTGLCFCLYPLDAQHDLNNKYCKAFLAIINHTGAFSYACVSSVAVMHIIWKQHRLWFRNCTLQYCLHPGSIHRLQTYSPKLCFDRMWTN